MADVPPTPDVITFEDFVKLDLRVGKVTDARAHPNADKLYVLEVDLGTGKRQLCAGLKGYYTPDQLIGKNIIVVVNLSPRKMRGEISEGMLLAASNQAKSQVILLTTDSEIAPGSRIS